MTEGGSWELSSLDYTQERCFCLDWIEPLEWLFRDRDRDRPQRSTSLYLWLKGLTHRYMSRCMEASAGHTALYIIAHETHEM